MKPEGVLDSFVAQESLLSARIVRALAEAVEQAGVPGQRLLEAARLEPAQLASDDACVPRAEMYRLCEVALDLTQDPALGLHWGERLSATTFNPLSHLIAHSATLRQGLESLFQFQALFSRQSRLRLCEREDTVTLECLSLAGESLRVQRFAAEMLTTGLVRAIRSFAPAARLARVSFEYAAPAYQQEYARVLEQPVHFDQPSTCIAFDRALMDTPSPNSDADVHSALRAIAERRLLWHEPRVAFALRVLEHLVQQGAVASRTEMADVARALGLSIRSLRRRLVAEGTSYDAVVAKALAIIAKQCLRNKRLTIRETAYAMGFADASAFHRAFKRWTGMTPNRFREQSGR